jgi:hypothetical protein
MSERAALEGSCHCGAVVIALAAAPAHVIDCNCSICRRYGALWALLEAADVRVSGHPAHTVGYEWGKRSIRTFHCGTCGCVTHWEPITPDAGTRFGVNMRNFDPAAIAALATRRFDGAESWTYLD